MNQDLLRERCEQLGIDAHSAARHVTVDPFFLIDTTSRRNDDGLPLTVLRLLSRLLDVSIDDLIAETPAGPPEETGDDLRLEAAFMVGTQHLIGNPLCRDDIAQTFGWTLDRVERALGALDLRLRGTGQRLHQVGWHCYNLGPNNSLLSTEERQRLNRRYRCGRGLTLQEAEVLRMVIGGWTAKQAWERPSRQADVHNLTSAGLLVDAHGHVNVPDDVRFSLRLDE